MKLDPEEAVLADDTHNNMRQFETGATRNNDTSNLDYEGFLSPLVIKRFGEYMHKHRLQADEKIRESVQVTPVKTIDEVLSIALIGWDNKKHVSTITTSQPKRVPSPAKTVGSPS